MSTADYTVRLEAFEGPLDLLLFLIRRAEVEITDIPVATIAEQYLVFLERGGFDSIDIERAGEFLVMAATLLEIKSRMVAPPETGSGAGGEGGEAGEGAAGSASAPLDPRAELVRQLLDYKRYRDAAQRLEEQRGRWESRWPAGGAALDRASVGEVSERLMEDAAGVELEDVELTDLIEAFARIIETVDLSRLGELQVVMDETPIELHAEDIVDCLRREGAARGGEADLEFAAIFAGRTRAEMIGLFLAMLELVRQRRVTVRQEEAPEGAGVRRGRIVLRLCERQDAPVE